MLTARIATIVVVQLWRLKKVPTCTAGKHMWTMLHVLCGDDPWLRDESWVPRLGSNVP